VRKTRYISAVKEFPQLIDKIMKQKTLATWLAFLFGAFGAHWFYLNQRRAWLYLLLFPLSFFAGCIDALRLGLMPDERWNQIFNPTLPEDTPQSSWVTVVGVGLALAIGVTVMMASMAVLFQWYFVGMAS
jgi:TM2 domain-containing membrane protein YozV